MSNAETTTYIEQGFLPREFLIPMEDYADLYDVAIEWFGEEIRRNQQWQRRNNQILRYDPLLYKMNFVCSVYMLSFVCGQPFPSYHTEFMGYDFIDQRTGAKMSIATSKAGRNSERSLLECKVPASMQGRPDMLIGFSREERIMRAFGDWALPNKDFAPAKIASMTEGPPKDRPPLRSLSGINLRAMEGNKTPYPSYNLAKILDTIQLTKSRERA